MSSCSQNEDNYSRLAIGRQAELTMVKELYIPKAA